MRKTPGAARPLVLAVAITVALGAGALGAVPAGAVGPPAASPSVPAAAAAGSAGSGVLNRISTIAGGGAPGDGLASRFDFDIGGVASFGSNLYVQDRSNHLLRRVDLTTGQQQVIAGTGVAGFSGDGGPARGAQIDDTTAGGVAADGSGVYLVGPPKSRVRKIDGAGIITTIAGTGVVGFWNGDGHLATAASLDLPQGVAVDGTGSVFIADTENLRVRKIAANGVISTVMGNGTSGGGHDGDLATNVSTHPSRVSVDSHGNLFVLDSGVVVVTAADQKTHVQHVAGGYGLSGYSLVDRAGTIYYRYSSSLCPNPSTGDCVIKRALDGTETVVDGSNKVQGDPVATDPTGRLLYLWGRVISVEVAPGTLERVVGGGPGGDGGGTGAALQAALAGPVAVAVDPAGNVIVADENLVKKITPAGVIATIAGNGSRGFSGEGGPALAAQLDLPHATNSDVLTNGSDYASPGGLAVDRAGTLYLSDTNNHRVRRVTADGTISTFAGGGTSAPGTTGVPAAAALLSKPMGLAFGPDGSLYIADHRQGVSKVSPAGLLTAVDSGVAAPTAVTVDPAGNLYVAASQASISGPILPGGPTPPPTYGSVTKVTPLGAKSVLAIGSFTPSALATDRDGNLYIGDGHITKMTPDGSLSTYGGAGAGLGEGGPATAAALGFATSSARSGPGGMYGQTTYYWADGGGLATDPAGNLYLASPAFLRVRMIEHTGAGFHPLAPERVVDTRVGLGAPGPITAGAPATVHLSDAPGVAATASALVLNVTSTESTTGSFLTVYPAGQPEPTASNVNFGAGETAANLVTVQVGPGGDVAFATALGTTHVVADLVGWFDGGGGTGDLFNGVAPTRLLDSRGPTGGWNSSPLGSGATAARTLTVAGPGAAPSTATAVVLNVTATDATAGSFLRLWPAGAAQPSTSNLNFGAGETRANLVSVPVGTNGAVAVANAVGETHVVVDLVGWFEPGTGSRFHALSPRRVLDDRTGSGLAGPWGAAETRALVVGGANRLPPDTTAVVANLTATNGTAPSFVTVYPQGGSVPAASSLNFGPGQTIANLTMAQLGPDGRLDLYNQQGAVDLIEDVGGYYSPN